MTVIVSCSNTEKKMGEASDAVVAGEKEQVLKVCAIGGNDDIAIRKGPGENYEKIINEKATQAVHETLYCGVDYSVKVELLEKKDEWAKIKVVEPKYLSDSHIGWIPSKYLISVEDEEIQSLGKLNAEDYEILKVEHRPSLDNFHVLLKRKDFDKDYVYKFINEFKKENCRKKCNVDVYDSKEVAPLIGVYSLKGKDYITMADHLIAISSFGKSWYPFQDFKYKELGGKNWKKEPIK